MNNIKVPYMPISNFDPSEFAKSFSEEVPDDKNSEESLLPGLETAEGCEISEEILLMLTGMGMEKYIGFFQRENVLLDTFLQLNDSDLQEIGITDPKDREIITKNLSVHQKTEIDCVVPENPSEDVRMLGNIFRHLHLLYSYCAYVELQMKKHKLTDYRINAEESACTYLKAFTEAALGQSNLICNIIYEQENCDSLIEKLVKANNLVLPKSITKLLPQKKVKSCGFCVFKCMAVLGIALAASMMGSYCIRNWNIAR